MGPSKVKWATNMSIHFLTRRLWSWRDEFGKDSVWQRLVGRHMTQAGADTLWAEITAA